MSTTQLKILLSDGLLERSSVVANSTMNRERACTGGNSYQKELSIDPISFLRSRLAGQGAVSWLDLCCGTGRALIEAADVFAWADSKLTITGLDLVGCFHEAPAGLRHLRLVETSLSEWNAMTPIDLITCVHGLHYIGDKLAIVKRALGWLKPDGVFAANLDLTNLKLSGFDGGGRRIVRLIRSQGVVYDARKHMLWCSGARELQLPFEYLGADDHAGPNYTGQAAVDSYYRLV